MQMKCNEGAVTVGTRRKISGPNPRNQCVLVNQSGKEGPLGMLHSSTQQSHPPTITRKKETRNKEGPTTIESCRWDMKDVKGRKDARIRRV